MKKRVRLTESNLHRIVKESVNRVLRESDVTSYNISGYDDKKSLIFPCLISGDEEFARTLLDELSDSAIEEIFNIVSEMGYEIV